MGWDSGHYEHLASQIEPAATAVVDVLAPAAGELVVDLGCGTGNAALIAARRGATVTGVDPAERLLAVARGRARHDGLTIDTRVGDAADIPLDTASADAVVSVFGVIFAPDAPAAAAEMARVLRPDGRIVLSAWLRDGALAAQARLRSELLAAAGATTVTGTPFAWHDPAELGRLFAPYGLAVTTEARSLDFVGASPAGYAQAELDDHPMWVESRPLLESAGSWPGVLPELTRLFGEANTDPAAFRITSHYVIATLAARG